MIDDKKIEKAAIVASISDTKKKCRVRDGYVINALADHESGFREGYIEGAKWAIDKFLKDLWHDESEKPVMSEYGMIIVELNDITACKYSLWRSTTTYETLCNNKGYIRRWLYLNDLLPKEGDNHD